MAQQATALGVMKRAGSGIEHEATCDTVIAQHFPDEVQGLSRRRGEHVAELLCQGRHLAGIGQDVEDDVGRNVVDDGETFDTPLESVLRVLHGLELHANRTAKEMFAEEDLGIGGQTDQGSAAIAEADQGAFPGGVAEQGVVIDTVDAGDVYSGAEVGQAGLLLGSGVRGGGRYRGLCRHDGFQ